MSTSWVPPWENDYPTHGNPVPSGVHVPWNKALNQKEVAGPVSAASASLEDLVKHTLDEAAKGVLPKLQEVLEDAVIREVTKVSREHPVPDPPGLDLSVLTRADARGAALRSLFLGISMSAMAGLATGISAASGQNWFTQDGAIGAIAILGGAVLHSVMTYAGHLRWGTPAARTKSLQLLKG